MIEIKKVVTFDIQEMLLMYQTELPLTSGLSLFNDLGQVTFTLVNLLLTCKEG